MKNGYLLLCLFIFLIGNNSAVKAQCNVDSAANGFYGFNDPAGGIYETFLCGLIDSVGTFSSQGYYDGDGYYIRLVAGSDVTFEVDQCSGNPVSMTVVDQNNQILPGAYSPPNCPNSVSFTAAYTGLHLVVLNLNGVCAGGGTSIIGYVHAKITPGTPVPDCPAEGIQVNDTICGAIPLFVDAPYVSGNTDTSFATDPMDIDVVDAGYLCSQPNNTMWYSFTPTADADTIYVYYATIPGSSFYSALGYFAANDPTNACTGGLNYLNCFEGFDESFGIDTVIHPLLNIVAGNTYYFMVDGFNNQTGPFSIRLESSSIFNQLNAFSKENISVFPNPATSEFTLRAGKTTLANTTVTVTNMLGENVFEKQFDILQSEKISTLNWASGMYFVKMTSGGQSFVTRILVQGY